MKTFRQLCEKEVEKRIANSAKKLEEKPKAKDLQKRFKLFRKAFEDKDWEFATVLEFGLRTDIEYWRFYKFPLSERVTTALLLVELGLNVVEYKKNLSGLL